MKIVSRIFFILVIVFLAAGALKSEGAPDIFKQVEKLQIQRNGYTLGAVLSKSQKKTAKANPVESASPNTYKFRDTGLFIVADKATDRVLVMYEQFDKVDQKKAQKITGDLFLVFEEPTVFAHDKVVYWAYGQKGKFTEKEYEKAKEKKKKLPILATVKLNSDIRIMEKSKQIPTGDVYYIISSEPLLKLYHGPGE